MKKLVRFITSRLFISAVLISLQLAFIFITFDKVINQTLLAQFLNVISLLLCLWVVFHKQESEYIIGWIFIIMLFPLYGIIFYILFGKKPLTRLGRKRVSKFLKSYFNCLNKLPKDPQFASKALENYDQDLFRQSQYISRYSFSPVCADTEVDYFRSGEEFFIAFKEELKKAEKYIFIEFFVLAKGLMWDEIHEILREKVKAGVEVRILYDDFGSFGRIPGNYDKILSKEGIKCQAFNPIKPHLNGRMNYRDHRKICVIDGNVGFTGGLNLADEYINRYIRFGHWKDTAICLKGEGVWGLSIMFLSMWDFSTDDEDELMSYKPTVKFSTDGFVQPFGDNPLDDVPMGENAYLQIINMAKKYVWITTPYLIINRGMLSALCTAAESGVDVRVITPNIPDKFYVHEVSKSFYNQLVKAGVKVYEYVPGFIHSKMFVCDDKVAIIGTINMDYRSFYLHFECGVALYGSSTVYKIKEDIINTIDKSKRISQDTVNNISLVRRLFRVLLRLLSPLM